MKQWRYIDGTVVLLARQVDALLAVADAASVQVHAPQGADAHSAAIWSSNKSMLAVGGPHTYGTSPWLRTLDGAVANARPHQLYGADFFAPHRICAGPKCIIRTCAVSSNSVSMKRRSCAADKRSAMTTSAFTVAPPLPTRVPCSPGSGTVTTIVLFGT